MPNSSHAFEEDTVVDIMAELCVEREHRSVFSYHAEIHTLLTPVKRFTRAHVFAFCNFPPKRYVRLYGNNIGATTASSVLKEVAILGVYRSSQLKKKNCLRLNLALKIFVFMEGQKGFWNPGASAVSVHTFLVLTGQDLFCSHLLS